MSKKLYLNKEEGKIGGVCAGLADYADIDVALIRILWLVAVICGGFGVLAYIIFWIVLDEKKVSDFTEEKKKYDIEL